MAIEVKGTEIIDDDRNIVGANTYNGYVPVNPTRAINSGNGIVGGGNLGTDRTLSIRAGDGLTANTTGIHIVAGNGLSVSSSNVYVNEAYLNERYANYRLLTNSALTFSEQIGIPANTGGVVVYGHSQGGAPSDSPSNSQGAGIYITNLWREHQLHFDANYKVFHKSGTNVDEFWTSRNLPNPANTATSIVAGNGLTGGGNLTTSRTLTVGAGDGISVLSTTVNVDNTVVRTSDTKNYSTTGAVSAAGLTSTNGLTVSSGGINVTGNSTLNGSLNVNNSIVAKNSLYVDATNTNIHMWFREASNNAARGVYYYDNANHALKMQLYAVDNSSFAVARTELYSDRFVSTVPFTGSGSGLTNLPATSLTGTIDDARLPTTAVRTSRTVTAGNGLIGGGALSGNITLTVGDGDGITVNATNVAVDSTVVRTSRTVTAGNGLTGGGALSGNISLTVGAGDGIAVGATTVGVDSTVARTQGAVPLANNQLRIFESAGFNYIQSSNGTTADFKTLRITPLGTSAAKLEVSNTAVTAGSGVVFTGNGSGLTNVSADAITGILGTDHLPSSVVYNTRTVTAGAGLTGGGALSGNISLAVGKGDGITVNATNVAVDSTVVRTSRTVSAGNGLTGGGALSGNISLAVGAGSGITVGSTSIAVNAGNGLVANSSGVHVQTGNGITQNSSHIYVVAGSGIDVTSTGVAVDSSVARRNSENYFNSTLYAHMYMIRPNNTTSASEFWFKDSSGSTSRAVIYRPDDDATLYLRTYNLAGTSHSQMAFNSDGELYVPRTISSGSGFSGVGTSLTNLNANNLDRGSVPEARLGNVRNVIADYSAGSVGSYAILRINSGDVNPGQTIGGAQLTYTSTSGDANGGTPAGTWRLMGRVYSSSAGDRTSLWLRIS